MNLLLGYREHDANEEIRQAAKYAIEQVGDFTLEIIEEEGEQIHGICTSQSVLASFTI